MIRKYGRPFGQPEEKETEKQKEERKKTDALAAYPAAYPGDPLAGYAPGEWARTIVENAQKLRRFTDVPQDHEQCNRSKLPKRKPYPSK